VSDSDSQHVAADTAGPRTERSTGAGRGVLYIAFAKFYFMLAGLVIQLRLPAILSRTTFGGFSIVSSIASWANNVLVTGTIQAVSRYSAQEPGKARAVQHAGLRMHVRVGLVIAVGFIAAAPVVGWYMHDPGKVAPLMLAGLILGGYAFYAVFIGTANGLHQFHKQAGLDISSATLRGAGILGMAMAGFGVVGVVGGWVAAVAIVMCGAVVWIGLPGPLADEHKLPIAPMLGYFGRIAIYLFLFNALMFVDSVLLKRLTTEHFAAHAAEFGASVDRALPWARKAAGYAFDPSALADVQNAYYAAVQNLARLSYQAIIAATFVVFPLVSRSTFTEDRETTRRYVSVTSRYSLIFALMMAVVMAANPVDVLGVVYQADYAQAGGPALVALALGNVAFSVLAINGTILNGAGLTRPTTVIAAIAVVVAVAGNYVAISLAADSGHALLAAAIATSAAMLVGAAASGAVLYRRLGAFIPLTSLVRIAIATAAAIGFGRFVHLGDSKPLVIAEAAAVAVVFLVVLVITRELGRRDLEAIKAVRAAPRSAGAPDAE
jgi:O-antigen/teichoic acid export membrane protein